MKISTLLVALLLLLPASLQSPDPTPEPTSSTLQIAPKPTETPVPTPTPTPALTDNTYVDPTYNWSVTWPDEWEARVDYESAFPLYLDTLTSTGEYWTTVFTVWAGLDTGGVFPALSGHAWDCLDVISQQDYETEYGPDGEPLQSPWNDDFVWGVFSYLNDDQEKQAIYVECHRLQAHFPAILQMVSIGPYESFNEIAPKIETLSENLQPNADSPESAETPADSGIATESPVASGMATYTSPGYGWQFSYDPAIYTVETPDPETITISPVGGSRNEWSLTLMTLDSSRPSYPVKPNTLTEFSVATCTAEHEARYGWTISSDSEAPRLYQRSDTVYQQVFIGMRGVWGFAGCYEIIPEQAVIVVEGIAYNFDDDVVLFDRLEELLAGFHLPG